GQQDDVAVARLRRGGGNRLGEIGDKRARHGVVELGANRGAGRAEQDEMLDALAQEWGQDAEVAALVITTGEQNHSPVEAGNRLLHGAHVRPLGVIEVAYAGTSADEREAVWQSVGVVQSVLYGGVGHTPDGGGGDRGHHVLAVVRPVQVDLLQRKA